MALLDKCYKITNVDAKDIRWPTSLKLDGSDAMVCKIGSIM